jgi:hypothetical protein
MPLSCEAGALGRPLRRFSLVSPAPGLFRTDSTPFRTTSNKFGAVTPNFIASETYRGLACSSAIALSGRLAVLRNQQWNFSKMFSDRQRRRFGSIDRIARKAETRGIPPDRGRRSVVQVWNLRGNTLGSTAGRG